MSGVFGFSREAIRVKVKKVEGSLPLEFRKFSVDPQITSFEVLQSILAKAFDLKGDFAICYRVFDVNGHETYIPLLSDWELDAAFLKAYNASVANASEPCLCLRVDLKPFEECSDDWELRQNVPIITQLRTITCQEAKPSPRLHGIFNQMGRTLNMVQKAFNFGEEPTVDQLPPRPPLSDSEFRAFLDPVGQIIHAKELRSVIYYGGIDPSLRKVVWKHLLNVYPYGMTGRERMDYIKKKATEYVNLREAWKAAIAQGPVVGELAYTTGMVRKDVLRTDRHHPFYAGSDDNQNIASLFNILTTYALNHPKVSYCQGMSDLASPLLVTMNDEAHAYICFCALMHRLNTNFMIDGIAMTQKFTHLAEGLMYYDPEFYTYLKIHQADDLLFCYRWLLLEMKREFAFEDSLRMLEVLWSSIPADLPEKEIKLYDIKFQPTPITTTPPISPLVKTPRENAYTKICALRRQSSSISLNNPIPGKKTNIVKRQIHSLDESLGRSKTMALNIKIKHQSLDDAALTVSKLTSKMNEISPKSPPSSTTTTAGTTIKVSSRSPNCDLRPRSISPIEQKSDSVLFNNRINAHRLINKSKNNSLSTSMSNLIKSTKKTGHFKELKDRIAATKLFSSLDRLDYTVNSFSNKECDNESKQQKIKMVKNLNEFLNFTSINKSKISDKPNTLTENEDTPKILLTKSSFDDSEDNSSFIERNNCSSTTSNEDDTFDDEYSPDDSQDYFPLTTSVTRELRLELENLDRKVFGDKFIDHLSESPSSDCSNSETKTEKIIISSEDVKLINVEKRKSDDIFIWENPLHQTSPQTKPILSTPTSLIMQSYDEQADLDYDNGEELPTLIDETSKTITPIKVINTSNSKKPSILDKCSNTKAIDLTKIDNFVSENGTTLTNSCEEVTEMIKSSLLPPPCEFGGGNPFLMFLCITVLLQHRERIMQLGMDYNEMAMHFDKMVRKHNVTRVLNQARQMYARYMKQHTIAQQQKIDANHLDCC